MSTTTTKRSTNKGTKSDAAKATTSPFLRKARSWLALKTQVAQETEQQNAWRDELKAYVLRRGRPDETGSRTLALPEPIEIRTKKGSGPNAKWVTKLIVGLKAQRSITPKVPLPDADAAEKLLREKGLWLSKKDEVTIQDINRTNRYVTLVIEVNPNALSEAELAGLITEKEYEGALEPQREDFSLVVVEA